MNFLAIMPTGRSPIWILPLKTAFFEIDDMRISTLTYRFKTRRISDLLLVKRPHPRCGILITIYPFDNIIFFRLQLVFLSHMRGFVNLTKF